MDRCLKRAEAPSLFYQIEGAGPPVMLIHGVGADGSSWDAIAPALVPRFTVLRLDLRGHGRSGHIDNELGLGDFVSDVIDVLDATDIPRAHIVGFSLGGMIAQALALDHASRVDRLVLLSAVAGRTEQERARVKIGWKSCARRASRPSPARHSSAGSPMVSLHGTPSWYERAWSNSSAITRHPMPRRIQCSPPAIWANACTPSTALPWSRPASTMSAPARAWRA